MENLKAPIGSNKKKRYIGRGNGSGRGRNSGRGLGGQNSRSGGSVRPGFEGGQMPLYRRIARRGFSNYPFKVEYKVFNLDEINAKFNDGDTVDILSLREKGLLKGKKILVKILGRGEIDKKLSIKVDKISASAKEKIEKAGGKIIEEEGSNG